MCYECSLHRALARGFATPQRVCSRCIVDLQSAAAEAAAAVTAGAPREKMEDADESQTVSGEAVDRSSDGQARFRINAQTAASQHRLAESIDSTASTLSTTSSSSANTNQAPASPSSLSVPAESGAVDSKRGSISGSAAFAGFAVALNKSSEDTPASSVSSDESSSASPPASARGPSTSELARASVESLAPFCLFNRLGGFGSLLVVDVRSAEEYRTAHVPRSLSLPIDDDAPSEIDLAETATTLAALERKLHLTDQRTFRMRQRCTVVIVARAGEEDEVVKAAAAETADGIFAADAPVSSRHASAALHLARLLLVEAKVSSVCVLAGGFAAFQSAYPYVCCSYSERECATGKHAHRKPFPWYPCEVTPAIFLGSKVDAANRDHLGHLRVDAVLNCTSEIPCFFEDEKREEDDQQPAFEYKRIELRDEVDVQIAERFQEAFTFIGTKREDTSGKDERRRDETSRDERALICLFRFLFLLLPRLCSRSRWSHPDPLPGGHLPLVDDRDRVPDAHLQPASVARVPAHEVPPQAGVPEPRLLEAAGTIRARTLRRHQRRRGGRF